MRLECWVVEFADSFMSDEHHFETVWAFTSEGAAAWVRTAFPLVCVITVYPNWC